MTGTSFSRRARSQLGLVREGYTYDEARALTAATLSAGISVLLRGHPGVGKSTLAAEVAEAMGLALVDIRLAQREPAELGGVYFPDRERGELALFPPGWVRSACREPVFVFLDEINAAVTRLHQAAAYQIVLERRVGPFRFHEGTVVMAAGNLEEDNAIVASLSSALCNRFAHLTLRVDAASWVRWAASARIDPRIQAYVAHEGEEALYDNNGEHAFPTPRSWAMASRVMAASNEHLAKRAVAACVGMAAAERFFSYLKVFGRVPVEAIVKDGRAMDFTKGRDSEPSFVSAAVFALAGWLCQGADLGASGISHVAAFLRSPGLDPEYVFLFLRQLRRRPEVLARLRADAGYRRQAGELVDLRTAFLR